MILVVVLVLVAGVDAATTMTRTITRPLGM
jgi:hypothetical protein